MTKSVSASRVLLLTSAAVFLLGIENGGFQLVLTAIGAEYSLSATAMGALVTAQFAAMLATPLLFGRFADRYGKKRLLTVFIPILIAGSLVVTVSRSIGLFLIGIFALGAGYSICESMGTAALSDADPQHAERNITLTQAFYSLGAMVSPLAVRALLQGGMSWRVAFAGVALGFVLLLPFVSKTPFERAMPEQAAGPAADADAARPAGRTLLCAPFAALVLAVVIYAVLEIGLAYFLDLFFQTALRAGNLSAFSLSAFWLAMMLSCFAFWRFHPEPVRAAVILYLAAAVILAALALCRSPWLAVGLSFLAGFTFGPIWPMLIGVGTRSFAERSGTAAGILMACSGLGGACGPTLLGAIADRMDVRYSILLLALAALLGGGVCLAGLGKLRRKGVDR